MINCHKQVLVVEDDPQVNRTLQEALRAEGLEATGAYGVNDGLEKFKRIEPAVIVLDLGLNGEHGIDLLHRIREFRPSFDLRVIVYTKHREQQSIFKTEGRAKYEIAGITDFAIKPTDLGLLPDLIKNRMAEVKRHPFPNEAKRPVFELHVTQNRSIGYRVAAPDGLHFCGDHLAGPRQRVKWSRVQQILGDSDGRQRLLEIGHLLGNELLVGTARDVFIALREPRARLCIAGPSDLLRTPYELIVVGHEEPHSHLCLEHPLARRVSGYQTSRRAISPRMFNEVPANRGMRVLLLGIDPLRELDSVASELEQIEALLQECNKAKGFRFESKVLRPRDTTLEQLQALCERDWDIVHIAGHGPRHTKTGQQLRLHRDGKQNRINTAQLMSLLSKTRTQFLFANCCRSSAARVRAPSVLSMSLVESALRAGIPSVLAFPVDVADSSAREFGLAFYRALLDHGDIEVATMLARRKSFEANDTIWVWPQLVVQRN